MTNFWVRVTFVNGWFRHSFMHGTDCRIERDLLCVDAYAITSWADGSWSSANDRRLGMTLGFTGTSRGMSQRQQATVKYLFGELQLTKLHHGDCIGADAQAHALAGTRSIIIHPPSDDKSRAFCQFANCVHEPKPYLTRNKNIVEAGVDGLIAAPKGDEVLRSGTWSTVRYARKMKRRIWIVRPDGMFVEERPDLMEMVE